MFEIKRGICYSGYRKYQSPKLDKFPSDKEVLQDLKILCTFTDYIRLFDTSYHCDQVLRIIEENNLPLKVMIGVEPQGEIDNPNCHFGSGIGRHSKNSINEHKKTNYKLLDKMLNYSKKYSKIVLALSIGNENTSDWHPNLISEESLIAHAKYVKSKTKKPITFCEGPYYWLRNTKLGNVVDFISIQSYPQWRKVPINEAFIETVRDYESVKKKFKDKMVIFTEFGWTTNTTNIMLDEASEENQNYYLNQIYSWSNSKKIQMFLFEAFDESWKGSLNKNEPEKHWGIYKENRKPKLWMRGSNNLKNF